MRTATLEFLMVHTSRSSRTPSPARSLTTQPTAPTADYGNQAQQRALPEPKIDTGFLAAAERAVGFDLGDVHLHMDGTAEALGAAGMATGQDVHLAGSSVDDQGKPDPGILAHELVHVAQQRADGPAMNADHEAEADQGAHAILSGGSIQPTSAAAGATQRKEPDPNAWADHVGGDSDMAMALNDDYGEEIQPGQAQYSELMLGASEGLAQEVIASGKYDGLTMLQHAPNTSMIDNAVKKRSECVSHFENRIDEEDSIVFPSPRQIEGLEREKSWASWHLSAMVTQREDIKGKFGDYNNWVPRANAYFGTFGQLESQMTLMGVQSLPDLRDALVQGLTDAGVVAHDLRKTTAGAAGVEGLATLNVPEVDNSMSDQSLTVSQKAAELGTAYLGFQIAMAELQKADIHSQGGDERARLAEIAENKALVGNIGKTIDMTMSVVRGAPEMIGKVQGAFTQGEAFVGSFRERMDLAEGGAGGGHNTTYITNDSKGNMVVRNMLDETQTDVATGDETSTTSHDMAVPTLPSSATDVLGAIADFVYADEVKSLNTELQRLKSISNALNVWQGQAKIKKAIETMQNAVNAYALEASKLDMIGAQRQLDYLELGQQLDAHARTNEFQDSEAGAQTAMVEVGQENYATVFAMTATVRELLVLGRGSISEFDSPDDLISWYAGMRGVRQANPVGKYMKAYTMGDRETARMNEMGLDTQNYMNVVEEHDEILTDVDTKAEEVLQQMNAGVKHGGRF